MCAMYITWSSGNIVAHSGLPPKVVNLNLVPLLMVALVQLPSINTVEPLYYGHFGTQNVWPLIAVV